MKTHHKIKLLEKGWVEKEIKHAEKILDRAEQRDIFLTKITFWSALVVIVFANIIVSLVLIPFLIVFNKWILYSIVIIIAGTIGFLYNFLINDISHLEKKHHLLAGIIIPLLALANVIVMVTLSNRLIVVSKHHNPWIVAVLFAVAFILPYVLDRIRIRFFVRRSAVLVV